MADGENNGNEIVLLKSEIEAAAARVAERALNDTWTGTSGFFGDVLGGFIGDRTKLWRTRNLVKSLEKTYKFLNSKGVNIDSAKSLPMGEALAIFDGASKTDDVDLSEMWSALLANSMNPQEDTFTDPSFVRLLNELSGLDARILMYFYSFERRYARYRNDVRNNYNSTRSNNLPNDGAKELIEREGRKIIEEFRSEAERMRSELISTTTEAHISYSISNLARLGLVDIPVSLERTSLLSVHQDFRTQKVIVATQRLEAELADLRRRIGFGFTNDKKLPKVVSDPSGNNIPSPGYNLTEYGERFLKACT